MQHTDFILRGLIENILQNAMWVVTVPEKKAHSIWSQYVHRNVPFSKSLLFQCKTCIFKSIWQSQNVTSVKPWAYIYIYYILGNFSIISSRFFYLFEYKRTFTKFDELYIYIYIQRDHFVRLVFSKKNCQKPLRSGHFSLDTCEWQHSSISSRVVFTWVASVRLR